MEVYLIKALYIILLLICSYTDIRYRSLSVGILAIFAVAGVGTLLLYEGIEYFLRPDIYLSPLPGLLLLIMSKVTHEDIGEGDACLLMVMGCFLDIWNNLLFFMLSSLLAGVYALILYLKRRNAKEVFPFVPFMAVAGFVLCITGR